MNKNRQYVSAASKGIAMATMASIVVGSMSQAAEVQNQVLAKTAEENIAITSTVAPGRVAGVFALENLETIETLSAESLSVAPFGAAKAVEELEVIDLNAEEIDFSKLLMANVNSYLNIRKTPSIKADMVGALRPNDTATIVSFKDGWYEILSGDIKGFVAEEYCLVGDKAKEAYEALSTPTATVVADKLNVRATASLEAEVVETLREDEEVFIDADAKEVKEWVAVVIKNDDETETKGYVSEEFVEVYDGVLGTAMTAEEYEEELAAIEAEKKAAAEAAAKAAAEAAAKAAESAANKTTVNAAVSVSADDETLLAALLQCEAGNKQGMLAVGGVVMNRLRAGYASDLRGVIYQKGQFSPAKSGKLDKLIASGNICSDAREAARAALAGTDITNGCKNFRSAKSGHAGTNIGGNVFF